MRSLTNQTLGRYQILELIGRGGMAEVYKAYDLALRRHVAVKVLFEILLQQDPRASDRFLTEAQNMAGLDHPHILPIYDYSEENGLSYFVMKLIPGGSLKDQLQGPLEVERAVSLVGQVADALGYAHAHGIIHRDVKTANVLMAEPNSAILSDFGIARALEQTAQLSHTGGMKGTAYYMSPEQARGEAASPKADQYALGVVLYEVLTGALPFQGDTPIAVIVQHIHSPLRPPRELNPALPVALEQVMVRALEKDPDARFPDTATFAAALRDAAQPSQISAPLPAPDASSRTLQALRSGAAQQAVDPTRTDKVDRTEVVPFHSPPEHVSPSESQHASVETGVGPQTRGREEPAPEKRRRTVLIPTLAMGALVAILAIAAVAYLVTPHSHAPPPGQPLAQWGTKGSGPGQFTEPVSVAIDAQGNVYVADTDNSRIQKLSPSGRPIAQWGTAGSAWGQLVSPVGVAVDALGNVYVADLSNNRLEKFSPTGRPVAQWGRKGTGPGQFSRPVGIALDGRGNVYVVDTDNNRIQKLSPSGRPLAQWGTKGTGSGQFAGPEFVAVDANMNVYVTDTYNDRIQKLSPAGHSIATWGTTGSKPGQFSAPEGVALDADGNIYVVDRGNNRIQKLSSTGQSLARAGTKGMGPGQFAAPVGIALDAHGAIYVADTQNHRIQKLSPLD